MPVPAWLLTCVAAPPAEPSDPAAELRRRERRLNEAQRVGRIGSWDWDIGSDVVHWSDELYRLFNVDPATFDPTYDGYLSLLHPDDREAADKAVKTAFETHKPFAFEHRVIHPDGTVRWIDGRGEVITDETGQPVRMIGTAQDITDRHAAESLFRNLVEAAPDATVIVDRGGSIKVFNAQAEAAFGYTRAEVVGQPVEMLIPERFVGGHPAHRDSFMTDPKSRPMGAGLDLWGRRKDGSEFPVEISLAPLETPEGLLVTAAIRDITDRLETSKELRRYATQLESSNRDLERFAYVASHDLREPLRTITAFTQRLEVALEGNLDEDSTAYMGFIQEGAKRMDAQVLSLLEYSRLGRSRLNREHVALDDVARAAVDAINELVREAQASITIHPLPEVEGDADQLGLVLQNLITNAIKFHGEVPPIIEVAAQKTDDGWQVTVQDDGIGIDPAHQSRIFEMFQRLHAAGEYPGTGMGLAIARRVVEEHGGHIGVESAPGQGSTFWFTLPDAPPHKP